MTGPARLLPEGVVKSGSWLHPLPGTPGQAVQPANQEVSASARPRPDGPKTPFSGNAEGPCCWQI